MFNFELTENDGENVGGGELGRGGGGDDDDDELLLSIKRGIAA